MSILSSQPSFTQAPLDPTSVISDLTTYEFSVDISVLGEVVASQFNLNTYLPGVIVTENGKLVAAISRRRFLALVGRRFGVEIYLSRPISAMVNSVVPPHLSLSHDCNIHTAAETALARPSDLFYEPIIIAYPDDSYRVLDVYTLLLAQSHLLNLFYQEEQNQRLLAESLQKTGKALSSTLKLGKLNRKILRQLFKVVRYERAIVFTSDGQTLESVAIRGFPKHLSKKKIKLSVPDHPEDVYRQIMQTRQPVIVPDVTKLPHWSQLPELSLNRSWLGVPLIVQDRVMGMISLTREEPNGFTENDTNWVLTFAGQAAVALDNARLYGKLEEFNEELEEMVEERTEQLNEAFNLLEKLDRAKSDFIAVTAHELRTPLTIIKGYAQLLESNKSFAPDSIGASAVKGILSGMERMHHVVNGMLDIARIDNDAIHVHPESISLEQVLSEQKRHFTTALEERQLSLDTDQLDQHPLIEGDSDLLGKLFYSLLTNAVKYTPDGGVITVSGELLFGEDGNAESVQVSVKDSGIGIDADYLELIFEKFYQTGEVSLHSSGLTKFKGGGPGLGLAIAKGVVEAHHGRIWAESGGYDEEACLGSTFHVVLPLKQPLKKAVLIN